MNSSALSLIAISLALVAYHPILIRSVSGSPIRRRILASAVNLTLAAGLIIGYRACSVEAFGRPCLSDGGLGVGLVRGLLWGLLAGGGLACVILIAAAFPSIAQKMRDPRSENLSRKQVGWMAGLIFIGTALPEEILFRGVLLTGWKVAGYSVLTAVLMSSVPFGLWHIAPELERIRENRVTRLGAATSGVLGAVGFTTLVGIVLAYLREATGSIWAGVVVHATANISALLAARYARGVLVRRAG